MSDRLAAGFLGALLMAAGCSTDGGDGPMPDDAGAQMTGGDAGEAAPFEVRIGTGRNTFQTLDNGDTLYLERGFQGLQHVLVGVRAWDLTEDRYLADFSLIRTRDGERISEPATVRLPFEAMADDDGVQILGYQLVVREPDEAVGEEAVVRAEIENADDEVSADARTVNVEWAPDDWDPDA